MAAGGRGRRENEGRGRASPASSADGWCSKGARIEFKSRYAVTAPRKAQAALAHLPKRPRQPGLHPSRGTRASASTPHPSAGPAEPPGTSPLFQACPAPRFGRAAGGRPGEARRRGSRGPAVLPRSTPPGRPPAPRAPSPAGARHSHVSAGHLHRLLEHFQAHGTRKAAERVSLGRRLRRLRGSVAGLRLRRRHLAAEERRAERERAAEGGGATVVRARARGWAGRSPQPTRAFWKAPPTRCADGIPVRASRTRPRCAHRNSDHECVLLL